jgi:hypothetical protein
MSAAPAMPCVLETARAVAAALPTGRPRAIEGLAFYRRHTAGLLHRYMRTSMEIGRVPSVLGHLTFRSRVSSYRLRTFEDRVIFIFDVEKCLKRLDPLSQQVVAHMALEDYTPMEAAALTGQSVRTVSRIYGEALDRLTRMFLEYELLYPYGEVSRAGLGNGGNGR